MFGSLRNGSMNAAVLRTARARRYLTVDIVEDACVHIPVGRDLLGEDSLVHDEPAREAILNVVTTLAKH